MTIMSIEYFKPNIQVVKVNYVQSWMRKYNLKVTVEILILGTISLSFYPVSEICLCLRC